MINNKKATMGGAADENSRPNYNGKRGIDNLLARLQKVKQNGSNHWIASCPSHQDKNPSLAIGYDNEKILLKCFAGCSAFEIVSAVGLYLSDLFPERGHNSKPIKNPFPAADVIRCIQTEVLVVAVIASDMVKDKKISEERFERLLVAVGRIGGAYEQ